VTAQRSGRSADATIGILGGGQLGRMLALAAARLGLKCHVLCPDRIRRRSTWCARDRGDYTDMVALDRFAMTSTSSRMNSKTSRTKPRPSSRRASRYCRSESAATTQDRLIEKEFVKARIGTASFAGGLAAD